ncbi:MAG: DEAD/DEAH box helicase [Zetaproteobacteria bacterium]|nr:DEAD/DEAH box helicase [Zetaproteobacteria bacterium]
MTEIESENKALSTPETPTTPTTEPVEGDSTREPTIEQNLPIPSTETNDHNSLEPTAPEEVFTSFTQAGLNAKLLLAIHNAKWERPSEIQSLCLPHTLKGRDVVGYAQTGSGKTGVFLLTIGHRLSQNNDKTTPNKPTSPRAIILTPTRELSVQIQEESERLLGSLGLKSISVYGGTNMEQQIKSLAKGVDLVTATPGRLRDLVQRKLIDLSGVEIFVCDEADRMFDMGFVEDVKFFLEQTAESTQRLMFSATANEKVAGLIHANLKDPAQISLHIENSLPKSLTQIAYICSIENKFLLLLSMLQNHQPEAALIFTNTKVVASWLDYKLKGNQLECEVITGDLPQAKRMKLINRIKKGEVKLLIATDVASRGIHIEGLTHVYNFDVPEDPAAYVHRIGRTGRAEAAGTSYTLVCDEYGHGYEAIKDILGEDLATPTWPDWDYSDVEDKTGNPFLDPNSSLYKDVVPSSQKPSERESTSLRSHGDSVRRDGATSRPRNEHRGRPEKHKEESITAKSKQTQQTPTTREKPTIRKETQTAENSTSILGIVRHFFSLLNPFSKKTKASAQDTRNMTKATGTPPKGPGKTREEERKRPRKEETRRDASKRRMYNDKRSTSNNPGRKKPSSRNSNRPENHSNNRNNNEYRPRRDVRGSSRPLPKKRPRRNQEEH